MQNPNDPNEIKADVLQSEHHTQLSNEEVQKAVERHKREHPDKPQPASKPNKKRNK
jgi:hypothetical protein